MPFLLDLPQEIRDEIISLVLTAEIHQSPTITRHRTRDHSEWVGGQHIFVPSSQEAYRPPSLGLLLTSKQLRVETLELVAREKTDVLVDLTILDMVWLWPTYRLILPRTTSSLNLLEVNIALAISDASLQLQPIKKGQEPFWGFVCRFLRLGPVGDVAKADPELNIRVRELRFNFDSKKHYTGNYLFSEEEVPMRTVSSFAHLTDNHKWLYGADAKVASLWIEKFIDFDISLPISYRPWITGVLERVERIVFCVDGQVRNEWASEIFRAH